MRKVTSNQPQEKNYLPAAGKDWLLPLYDPLTRLLGIQAYRKKLVEQATLQQTHRVLDIGCGTGTLILMIKQLFPGIEVVGLDPDPKALRIATRKTGQAQYTIQFDQGFSDALPYPSASFDRVFSSFMLHHVHPDKKEATLREARRVLTPEGSLHVLDVEHWRQSEEEKEDPATHVLRLMQRAGFALTKKLEHKKTLFGPVAYYMAS